MDDRELEHLLADLESDRAERKASASDKRDIHRVICAFANDLSGREQPGVLFIGANNDGSCSNVTIDDQLLNSLSNMGRDGSVHPFPTIQPQKKNLKGCELVVVIVQPSDDTPIRYNQQIWVRVGPTTQLASPEEERRLTEKRRSKDLPFDLRPVSRASREDLDLDLFNREYLPNALHPEVLGQNQRTQEQQLASLRFGTIGPELKPTNLGLLVSGKEPTEYIPGAYVQFARFDGTKITDPIVDEKRISGPLPELLRRLEETLGLNIRVALDIKSQPTEIRRPDYPIVALQQLSYNAVLHRNYEGTNAPVRIYWFSDRIEILSPGGPYGQVTCENFGQPGVTDYRNPHLAEAMENLGYVQKFGMGIPLAREELSKNGNPLPDFQLQATQVLAIVRARP